MRAVAKDWLKGTAKFENPSGFQAKLLKVGVMYGIEKGTTIGVMKWDTRNLDYGPN